MTNETTNGPKRSAVERIKESSNYLRGEIAAELNDGTDHFSGDSVQLLKHHGTYQQDNRDERAAARAAGDSSKHYSFLLRTRVAGGRLTAKQLLAELDLGDDLGSGTLRITSRQSLQLHGILKSDLRTVIRQIQAAHLTTLGACGDVNRNVMCCPAPYADSVHQQMQALTLELANTFSPRTRAYHDLWLVDEQSGEKQLVDGGTNNVGANNTSANNTDAENADAAQEGEEPFYGKVYLPRKFKIGIALPDDNCIDIYTHDVGLLAIVEQGTIVGYNVLVGGGMGVTPSNKKTYPALGKKLTFVTPEQVVAVCRAVIEVQRDHGNRADRKIARLKYLVDRLGIDPFRAKVETAYGQSLPSPHAADVQEVMHHMGWTEQGDGRLCYGLNIENGRIADTQQHRLKAAIREICHSLSPGIRLTAQQSILFTDIQPADRDKLEDILTQHDVTLSDSVAAPRKWSMACVAWPTCGLAITESERALPGIMDQIEGILGDLGLDREELTVRMTGCPNGCVRPYNADIGLVGKARGRYTMLLGGNRLGTRLNFIFKDLVPADELVAVLQPLFAYFQQSREPNESFGDFCSRKGKQDLLTRLEQTD